MIQELPNDQRFVSYVAISLRRYAVRWKKNFRSHANRECVTLNQSFSDDEGGQVEALDLVRSQFSLPAEDEYLRSTPVNDQVTDRVLYTTLLQLTPHQSYVLKELIIIGERQQVIAERLGVTQQAVQRCKQQALRRLHASILDRR